MGRRSPVRLVAAGAALGGCLVALAVGEASAGEYKIKNCRSNPTGYSTQAFSDFATRGMLIKRACNPQGPGLRGLMVSNVVRRGRVRRGDQAKLEIHAPPGTHFVRYVVSSRLRRRDCRYALQIYADGPGIRPVPIRNARANQKCPPPGMAQAAGDPDPVTREIPGATRIVHIVICAGSNERKWCSARGLNYVRIFRAEAVIADVTRPTVGVIPNTPLATGQWVAGTQPLNYTAVDNVGVKAASALLVGRVVGTHPRPCNYSDLVPCMNGPGQIAINTKRASEGTQPLLVQATDTAGNAGNSPSVIARIDNTPPARVDVGVVGGQGWTNRNDFRIAWANPAEPDRAPITSATYKLCRAGGGSCSRTEKAGVGISGFDVGVPAPGEWTLSLWRRDAAGNEEEDNASVPVTLRYDPEPPQLGFEAPSASDPTRVSVLVNDPVSGLAGGQIELTRQGSGVWQALPTEKEGTRLTSRIDDSQLPGGTYMLRARAFDQAHNEGSTDRRLDGQQMVLTLPLRILSSMRAGVSGKKTVRRTLRRHGRKRRVRRRVTVLRPLARVRFGRRVQVGGRLTNRDGQGIGGAQVEVYSRTRTSPERLVAVVQTDGSGRYAYTATASASRTLRFAYHGTQLTLPAQQEVNLLVPAASTLRARPRSLLNGQAVTFRGGLRGLPPPPGGKLVELQVRLSGRWQTFRTTRTSPSGTWETRYRFQRTRGLQRFRFRARLPSEAGYPYEAGATRALTVRVKGR